MLVGIIINFRDKLPYLPQKSMFSLFPSQYQICRNCPTCLAVLLSTMVGSPPLKTLLTFSKAKNPCQNLLSLFHTGEVSLVHSFLVTHLSYFSSVFQTFSWLFSLSQVTWSIVSNFSAQTLSLITPDITLFYIEGKKTPLNILPRSRYLINSGVLTPLFQAQLMDRTVTTTHMQEMQMRDSRGNVYPPSDKKPIFPEKHLPFSQSCWDLIGTLPDLWCSNFFPLHAEFFKVQLLHWSLSYHTMNEKKWIRGVLAVATEPWLWFFLKPLPWDCQGSFLFVQSQPSSSNQ